jgi:thioredoxin-related protein
MKFIKTIIVLALVFATATAFTPKKVISPEPKAKELKWYTDFEEARLLALDEDKVVFAFFTGSDWCGWCTRLKKNVFDKPSFVTWADKNVILLELDFPRRTQLPAKLKEQNQGLAQAFQVRGYPTIWLFNADVNKETQKVELKAYGSGGYPSGATPGKEEVKFIADMEKILVNR